ncbi:ABC transporter permease [Micromonospora sp. NBC_01813]|uniref:ABC transporter permease n=1 Tax=Micromonospora sp. NBC_01813 TaxID=2975988 RepID=UPI002DD8BDBA|nr:ABC transporter permease [Micromonospora sp. NBC_01813]WSA11408.1 ABC transporter permease [Micromonospora sp. NBC_01813]
MGLVHRRARAATGLLLAACGAATIAIVALTGLTGYSRQVVDAGTHSAVDSAPARERSILVRGPVGRSPQELAERDSALRSAMADGVGGRPATVTAAGYAAGRQFAGPTGDAAPDPDGVVYASVAFLDDLADHAVLVAGTWPVDPPAGDGGTVQATLAQPAADLLGIKAADRVPILDRITGRTTDLVVTGIWRATDPQDSFWRLAPEAVSTTDTSQVAAAGAATYGPLVVRRADFDARFLANASAAWLIDPDLSGLTRAGFDPLRAATTELPQTLPQVTGLGSAALVDTELPRLVDRLQRAQLVGSSALVTPVLLVLILAGYTLLLVALLLVEHRRDETALLRARGADRARLASMALHEAVLVVAPAVLLAPPLAVMIVGYAGRLPAFTDVGLWAAPRLDGTTWLVAGLAAVGCVLAIAAPALRGGGTYTSELATHSRPRRAALQRAGADLALVGLAVLAWLQLRQYASPLSGVGAGLGIDPLLAAAPTLAVLAGTVLALRLLPVAARLAEQLLDRRPWPAALLGSWQAGRRPHAGPVLLVALAVAVGTLAWTLAGTAERSRTDQADHLVGADLRLVETTGFPPAGRTGQIADLPGDPKVLTVWRDTLRLGPVAEPASLVALDAGAAAGVLRIRDDLAGGSATALLDTVARDRTAPPVTELPAGTVQLTGLISTNIQRPEADYGPPTHIRSYAVFTTTAGYHRVPLGVSSNGESLRFAVDVPADALGADLAGFQAIGQGSPAAALTWRLAGLRAVPETAASHADGGDTGPALDDTGWQVVDATGDARPTAATTDGLTADYQLPRGTGPSWRAATIRVGVVRTLPPQPVPVLATPAALTALDLTVGAQTRLFLASADVEVRIAGVVQALPGDTAPAAVLADLPALAGQLFYGHGIVRPPQEWWVRAGSQPAQRIAGAATALGGLRVLDRRVVADELAADPFRAGARSALFAAALCALLLAAIGLAVDIRATARRRRAELAILRTLGAGRRMLARSLLAEQIFLAGLGVLVGAVVGLAVAATTAPLVILTPTADRPTPEPVLSVDWLPVAGTAVGLLVLALAMSMLVAAGLRGRIDAALLRTGGDQ